MKQMKISLLWGCILLGLINPMGSAALAGPVARELAERGDHVGVPKPRPQDAIGRNENQTAIPNVLDGAATFPDQPAKSQTAPETAEPAKIPDKNRNHNAERTSSCLASLQELAVAEPTTSPETSDPACRIPDPVLLKQTKSRFPVKFTSGLILDCPFALSLARFTNDTAQALARYHLGATIDTVLSGEGFVCRRRNNAATGKLSEHSFGNATDWVGFKFTDGSRLQIKDASLVDTDQAGFLNSLRAAACGTFTTILGPGANAAHATHFHFDLGRSKENKNPYRICE